VMEKVAEAYPPVTVGEQNIIDRFRKDMEHIVGDPVFYAHAAKSVFPKQT
jgi:hypothetical protein